MASASSPSVAGTLHVPAEVDDELFDIYDDLGAYIGTGQRHDVHTRGIWHKSVYCFVFNSDQHLLLQRRSSKKKISPLQWDLSVAEHLQPGETFKEGAERGLKEELGIVASIASPALGPTHKRSLVIPGLIEDNEFVQSFRLDGWDGPVNYNEEEVCEVKYVPLQLLKQDMESNPNLYTPWLRDEINGLGWFEHGLN